MHEYTYAAIALATGRIIPRLISPRLIGIYVIDFWPLAWDIPMKTTSVLLP